MIVVLRPGIGDSLRDMVRELRDLADGQRHAVRTGMGGLVVSEELAWAYLSARRNHQPTRARAGAAEPAPPADAPEPAPPADAPEPAPAVDASRSTSTTRKASGRSRRTRNTAPGGTDGRDV